MKVSEHKCFICGISVTETASAYCPSHQPKPGRFVVSPRQCGCVACGEVFTSPASFDKHQRLSVRTGKVTCKDPRTLKNKHGARELVMTKRGWGKNPERGVPQNPWWKARQSSGSQTA